MLCVFSWWSKFLSSAVSALFLLVAAVIFQFLSKMADGELWSKNVKIMDTSIVHWQNHGWNSDDLMGFPPLIRSQIQPSWLWHLVLSLYTSRRMSCGPDGVRKRLCCPYIDFRALEKIILHSLEHVTFMNSIPCWIMLPNVVSTCVCFSLWWIKLLSCQLSENASLICFSHCVHYMCDHILMVVILHSRGEV